MKKKTTRILLWTGVGISLSALILFRKQIFGKGKDKKGSTFTGTMPDILISETNQSRYKEASFPISKWDKGNKVKVVQRAINRKLKSQISAAVGANPHGLIAVDGYFGEETETGLNKAYGIKKVPESLYIRWKTTLSAANLSSS